MYFLISVPLLSIHFCNEEEEEECFYSTIQCNTMIRIKDIYREQFGQETPIKMQLASLSWEPPTEQTKYIMPTRDI